jgi:hypothetical protein
MMLLYHLLPTLLHQIGNTSIGDKRKMCFRSSG